MKVSTILKSETSSGNPTKSPGSKRRLPLGVLAMISALAGGLAIAWWYRQTLNKLRESGEIDKNPHFGMEPDESTGDGDRI